MKLREMEHRVELIKETTPVLCWGDNNVNAPKVLIKDVSNYGF